MPAAEESRARVQAAMADLFLDTETRFEVPLVALACLDAGLTPAEAREIWCHEVTPAVGINLFSVAGAWLGWDSEWLRQRIERRSWIYRTPGVREVVYWSGLPLFHGVFKAVARCMAYLASVPEAERKRHARALRLLAYAFLGFTVGSSTADETRQAAALYPEPFMELFGPMTCRKERTIGDARIRQVIAKAGDSGS